MSATIAVLVAVLAPALGGVLILLFRNAPNVRETWTVLAATTTVAAAASLVPTVRAGAAPELRILEIVEGVSLGFRADTAGVVFALMASVLWLLTSSYSIGYVRTTNEQRQTRYFVSFAVCMMAVGGLAFAADLFTFFVFYELLTIATYPLVTHKDTEAALAAGRRYLAYLLSGGLALLLAMAILYSELGTLEFTPGGFVAGELSSATVAVVFALIALGFGTKSAIMPLHAWLPSAMIAPTPVSALLHAVAVVKGGVFGFVRGIGFVLGPEALAGLAVTDIVAALAATTILVASVIALRQDNLKRRLAFSTVAHLSYIVLGLSLLSTTAWDGGMYHLVNHAALKITLFFCAGAIYAKAHLDSVSQLDGIGRQMPVTMGAFAVASLGLAGLPPMGGFVSKTYLVTGAAGEGQVLYAAVLLTSSVLTAGYLFPIVYRAFFAVPSHRLERAEAPAAMVVPLALTAALSVALGAGDLLGMHTLTTDVAAAVTGAVGR
jgi:multicomponent Na+:H+ antiporter subunit D